jgi:hypothetical protein
VLDFFVDHLATESRDVGGLSSAARAFGELAENVDVLSAGSHNVEYLEKLARLDFQSTLTEPGKSPIEAALRALLYAVRKELDPDFLFLDARSGLHDLAGLSLHGVENHLLAEDYQELLGRITELSKAPETEV